MSSSMMTANTTAPVSAMATAATNLLASLPGTRAQPQNQQPTSVVAGALIPTMNAQFREIHKNTWLKRLTAEGKKICVGPKKSERSWVVFCVHDDTEALLEGYAEPRQAPSHNPEWIVSMQDTLHISHALIPNSHEFEFVVTLSNEVVRFHAMSWDIMQEWVETLRSKLREMKILSPRENLYTKLPEVRAPLLPTRDPTSPLPAPPPVPAAIVPGVERVIPPSVQQHVQQTSTAALENQEARNSINNTITSSSLNTCEISSIEANTNASSSNATPSPSTADVNTLSIAPAVSNTMAVVPNLTSMSNTLTQNLLNMLSDPISAYSEQLNDANSSSSSLEPDDMVTASSSLSLAMERDLNLSDTSTDEEFIGPLLRKPSAKNSDTNNSVRLDVLSGHRASADQIRNLENILQCERYIPRPQTSRSLSAGAVDKSKRQNANHKVEPNKKLSSLTVANASSKGNNITELEVNLEIQTASTSTTSSTSSSSNDTSKSNITIIKVSTENSNDKKSTASGESEYQPPKLPHKTNAANTSAADIFKFPETHVSVSKNIIQHEYKSNVQIIPSSSNNSSSSTNNHNSSTIQVMGNSTTMVSGGGVGNQYTTPVKKSQMPPASATIDEHSKITTVHVSGIDNAYGTCFTPPSSSSASLSHTSTPKMPKKIILSANTSGITNITVNNTTNSEEMTAIATASAVLRKNSNEFASTSNSSSTTTNSNKNNGLHYEKVFLSTSAPLSVQSDPISGNQSTKSQTTAPNSPKWSSPHHRQSKQRNKEDLTSSPLSKSTNGLDKKVKTQDATKAKQQTSEHRHKSPIQIVQQNVDPTVSSSLNTGSPAMARRRFVSPTNHRPIQSAAIRPPFQLTRGLTEAVITSRPSRKDFHFLNKISVSKTKSSNSNANNKLSNTANNNENGLGSSTSCSITPPQLPSAAINRTTSEALEQRRRSSSTSDAQTQRHARSTNNNDPSNRVNVGSGVGGPLRNPPQPFRLTENILGVSSSPGGNVQAHNTTSPAKRMTLREQQVMQLRREIMHPGGVRLQLRRKDCVGSIAWVDSFGAVWVAGWKQKEHPVLYNALHIGDQLLSIAGVTISSATEANKIIRNTNTLFVEVLVRRIPFGRGYAIRREREGQCLGLIRDGNTATIVDVVPNSLAARHGLPPKAQSCDGTTLTFWVLTEINGRPLNLFFKDNEIRDRLNSVGRDISILVQPSDLITKLKKQLKSLRGYKDYLVQ